MNSGALLSNFFLSLSTLLINKKIIHIIKELKSDGQSKSIQIIPTRIEFVDIAGLVKGASKGEGLGNQFLGQIRQVAVIIHVIRCFEDDNITHVAGKIAPLSDIEVIETELLIKDLESIDKRIEKLKKLTKTGDKQLQQKLILLTPQGVVIL